MKINPILHESLKATALGRAKLKVLFSLSKKDGIMPTKQAGIDFINSIPEEQFTVAEFFTALLTLRNCRMVILKSKSNFANLNSALKKLDQFPVTAPVFYQFKGKYNDTDLCAFVKGDRLRDFAGHMYTIYIFDEESMPNSFRSVVEVRSSQSNPEPAFRINHGSSFEHYAKTDPTIFENAILSTCVDLLIELANNHLNAVIPMSQVSQPDFKSKHLPEVEPPKDKTLFNLLRLVRQKKAQCFAADVPLNQIVPFSYEHCVKYLCI